jgi:hypothetical protein
MYVNSPSHKKQNIKHTLLQLFGYHFCDECIDSDKNSLFVPVIERKVIICCAVKSAFAQRGSCYMSSLLR